MEIPQKKLLLISHAYHQRTKSIGFLIELFQAEYDLTCCYLDPSSAGSVGSLAEIRVEDYELVVCIQVVPPKNILNRALKTRLVFIPMYDFSESWGIEHWFPFRKARIVSFSSTLARRLESWGFDVKSVQYFPEPLPVSSWGNLERAFFWNRVEEINLKTAATLLAASPVTGIHVHRSMDPGQVYTPPDRAIYERFSITETEWFETRESFRSVLEDCSVYIAPRRLEGIGLSFLEAMAMGRCVVAPDLPTMNEYITDGETGILYDPINPRPIELVNVRDIQHRALASIKTGRVEWNHKKEAMVAWCKEPAAPRMFALWKCLLLRVLLNPVTLTRSWRRWLISIRLDRKGLRIRCLGMTLHLGK